VSPSPAEWLAAVARDWGSLVALVVANLVTLGGVLTDAWSTFDVVFLYWSENVIIGVLNLLKMLIAGVAGDPRGRVQAGGGLSSGLGGLLFLCAFFTVHYGLFTFIHGVFVMELFGGAMHSGGSPNPFRELVSVVLGGSGLCVGLLSLAGSHGLSFVSNFLIRGEYRQARTQKLFVAPYGRIVLLHLVVLGGGFATTACGSPLPAVALLVLTKTATDVGLHLRAHGQLDRARVGGWLGKPVGTGRGLSRGGPRRLP